jgi:DNA-binding beta-propeller fold protein YncE
MTRALPTAGLLALSLVACGSEAPPRDLPYQGSAWPEARASHRVDKADLAIVTNNAGDSISVLDLRAGTVAVTAPIDLDPIANDGPHHAVIDAAGEFLYTPLAYPRPTTALGPHAQHGASQLPGVLLKLRVADLSRVSTVTLESNPGDILLTPDGKRAIVSHFDLSRAIEGLRKGRPLAEVRSPIVILDTATLERSSAPAPCIAAHGMAIPTDGKTLYLACYGEDAIAVVDLEKPTDPATLWPLGASATPGVPSIGPYFVVLAPGEQALVVAESEGKALRMIDRATGKTTARSPLPGAVFGPTTTRDGTRWIVPVQGPDGVHVVDATTVGVTSSRAFSAGECQRPHQAARHGERIFLVCEGDHVGPGAILEIDPNDLSTLRRFEVGAYPDVIAFPAGQGT